MAHGGRVMGLTRGQVRDEVDRRRARKAATVMLSDCAGFLRAARFMCNSQDKRSVQQAWEYMEMAGKCWLERERLCSGL